MRRAWSEAGHVSGWSSSVGRVTAGTINCWSMTAPCEEEASSHLGDPIKGAGY